MPMLTRFEHEYQTEARQRIRLARKLMAEASGLLRACRREMEDSKYGVVKPSPDDHAGLLDDIDMRLRKADDAIYAAPAGSTVE